MKKITFLYLIPVALLVLRSLPAAAEDKFDIIRKNIVAQQPTPTISDAEAIQKQQQQNGSWYDVNYADRHGTEPRQLYKTNDAMVWHSHVPNSKDIYVALFNLAAQPQDVDVNFAQLGLNGRVAVRDLWGKQDVVTL